MAPAAGSPSNAGSGNTKSSALKVPLTFDANLLPSNSAILFSKIVSNCIRLQPKPPANPTVAPSWVTARCDPIMKEVGLFQFSVVVDAVGNPDSKVVLVGIVPPHYSQFGEKMSKHGGWCFGSDGVFRGVPTPEGKGGKIDTGMKFSSGDRVTIRLDTDKSTLQLFVGKKVGKPIALNDFDPIGGAYAAVSFFNYSTSIKLESVTDISAISLLASFLQLDPNNRKMWERLYNRMLDGEKIQLTENGKRVDLTKEEVRMRMVIWGGVETWHDELGPILSNSKSEALLRTAAMSSKANFLNLFFRILDEQKEALMKTQEDQTVLIQGLIKRLDDQEVKFGAKLKALEEMCAHAHNEAATCRRDLERMQSGSPFGNTFPRPKTSGDQDQEPAPALNIDPPKEKKGSTSAMKPVKPVVNANTAVRRKSAASSKPPPKKTRIQRPTQGAPKRPAAAAKKTVHSRPASPARPSSNDVVNEIRALVAIDAEIAEAGEKGSPTDADLKKVDQKKEELGMKKLALAKKLLTGAPAPQTEDAKEEIATYVEHLVAEGDHTAGNKQLVGAFIHQIPTMDWGVVVSERGLCPIAAFDGSAHFLENFLALPKLQIDAIELVQACFYNQTCRIPMSLLLLKHPAILEPEDIEEDVSAVWQEFFEDVASEQRAIPKEDRTGRMQLLTKMLQHPKFKLDMTAEGADGQTIFSRAAKEGDLELVHLLLEKKYVTDPNRVQSDSTNALMQATVCNKTEVVQYLTQTVPDLDVSHVSVEGSALYLAKSLCRDPAIISALTERKAPLTPPNN